jgi:hypothetical protein
MVEEREPLEIFWDSILSRDPELIQSAFTPLDTTSQENVLAHLKRMVSEEGWHPEQIISAKAALNVLKNWNKDVIEK